MLVINISSHYVLPTLFNYDKERKHIGNFEGLKSFN